MIIGYVEPVLLLGNRRRKKVIARIDTGAFRSSVDITIASELRLKRVGKKRVRSALAHEERPVVNISFYLAGKKIETQATVARRSHMTYSMLVGRRDLEGFLVEPSKREISQPL